MGAFAQLKLLLWKNILTQIRSAKFTALEFILPLVLIVSSFGALIGLKNKYEKDYADIYYSSWPVTGSGYDLIIDPGNGGTILDLETIYTGKNGDCDFLSIKFENQSIIVGIDFYYAPSTP
uniref:Uncharacterized protein n=1 Tax=Panagrolaimus sp. JU765 TaxID=591449 RepID=A0AC34RIE1_9BILA